MESDVSPPASGNSEPRLAPGGTPLSRLSEHAKGLSDDVRAWLELRYELAKIELFERLNEQADQLVLYAIIGAIGAIGGLVSLFAACFAASWVISALTGWTIGALFLGFLFVAVVFFALAGLLYAAKPRFGLLEDKTRATLAKERVMSERATGQRAPSSQGQAS